MIGRIQAMGQVSAVISISAVVVGLFGGCGEGGGISAADGHKGVGTDCYERVEAFLNDGGVDVPSGIDISDAGEFIEDSCEETVPTTTIERAAVHAMFLAQINQLAHGG